MGHHHHHHGHHHHHHHHHHHGSDHERSGNRKGLMIALLITFSIMLAEFIGGWLTNSLALLSDAGHMLSDASSLLLSLFAIWFASRRPTSTKTFGYHRLEILAAFINGITLFAIAGLIVWEAIGRLLDPPTVASGTMIGIACIGLIANLLSAWSLVRNGDVKGNVNVRSAYLHVLGDALGSVGAILAGILMLLFGWYIADPLISMVVAVLILKSGWGILTMSIHILMEGTPTSIALDEIRTSLENLEGVRDVHDLHVWTITSGLHSLTCHLLVEEHLDSQSILRKALHLVEDHFHIQHATIQIETSTDIHAELTV